MPKRRSNKNDSRSRAKNTEHDGNDPLFDQIDDWLRTYLEDAFASVEVEDDTGDESEDSMRDKSGEEAEE